MKTAWLTYAWADNDQRDVEFIAQELEASGVNMQMDRWVVSAGKRLWAQIGEAITNPDVTDGWIFFATENSLKSEACLEELSYALDRALSERGSDFPIIGLFPGSLEAKLIPPAIKTRLYVSLRDPDWKERIVASVEGRAPSISRSDIEAYFLEVHALDNAFVIEVRPRGGTWSPFIAAIPASEKDSVNLFPGLGPAGRPQVGGVLKNCKQGLTGASKEWWMVQADNEASPTQSYYIRCETLPSVMRFGQAPRPAHSFSFEN